MGNLLGGVSFREPTTVEDCDSTWQTDSEPEPEELGPGGGEGRGQEPEQPAQPRERAGGRPCANPAPDEDAEAAGAEQSAEPTEATAKPKRSFYAARDLYKYRHQYPNFKDIRYQNDLSNLRFYKNKIPFKPDGVYIEEVLSKWKGDYEKLEHNHTYIQWLFPLREQGLNFYAKELTTYEIEEFKKTKEAIRRFLLAYKMMLEFFGIKLIDKTGNVARAVNWQERFQHLNESQHNYLRITRILKSLGELGYESFKSPLVKFILHEALVENTIPNIKQSALEYFVYTIRDRRERRKLLRFAQKHYTPSENFIWGPPRKEQSEGSKVPKTSAPLLSSHNSQTSVHKKSKDSKISSSTVNLNSKTVEEKKGTPTDLGSEADKPRAEPSDEAAKPRNSEDSNAENSDSQPEEKRDSVSPSEKEEEGENGNKDCESPGNTSSHDDILLQ
ncbi:opioid growth factor receptor-like protein 1 isoform X1 [Dasypus novemcinctus]|uniref:opioid growth factor receptor-like protein 1 isoform X1 n=1 Tax=Dasypus novemcinctus TaxID=9361 RepID=UPI00265E8DBD|nr:opioid growth factor receptor-like protein 1 isoform X2 [Dasypus novemcinctus]